ncbi:MAG: terminase large subunit [Clostridium saudiense]|uniref:terminase large subunit n=1 Tax=Clostridium saudiense TaxID=1414720 RepID=UPI003995231F
MITNNILEKSWILKYIDLIDDEEIIVGEELYLQLEKLKKELTDPIYQNIMNIKIDFEASEKRIKFIENECKHFEAPHAGKPFILEIFQKAFVEAIFAIKIYDEEVGRYIRKYQDILFLVGRKNGKTPLIGAICLSEWFCGEMGKKILCASNDYEQAGLMFDAINSMREESRTLEKVTRKNLKGIYFGNPKTKKKKGKFSYQNKGSIRKLSAKSGAKEGRNIGIGAVDEVFEMEDDTLVMPIRQALSTQDEPLYFELTTEGFTQDGYLDKRLIEARKVLNGEKQNERWLIWLYTQDCEEEVWEDETSWQKSNPGIGKIKKWSFLRRMIEEARDSSSTKAFVLAKDFNVKQNNAQAWLSNKVIENELEANIEDFKGKIGIGAADLSETNDLTNARILFYDPKTKSKTTFSKYFIPESKLRDMEDGETKNRFREWIKDGYIHECEGNEVEQSDVVEWFVMLYKKYKIKTFLTGYDKWQAKAFKSGMEDYGFDVEKIGQAFELSSAMDKVEADLKDNLLNYAQNPVDIMCLKNVSAKWKSDGTKRAPVKVQGKPDNWIDGAVTILIAYETLNRYKKDYTDIVRR